MAKSALISKVIEQNKGNEYYKNFKFNYSDRILREHNQETYEKIVKGLVTGNKVLFEQATGTGKSYLALKFLHDHAQGKRVLFVSPANAIKDSFTDLCNKWLGEDYCKFDTCLYQGLKSKQNKHYDIIIFDEVHRMGAKTWGPNAEILMNNNPNASILGMTATLDRPDCVDVRQYFDNREPVSRITLVEALEKGILPKPDYTLAKVDFEDDVKYIDTCIKDFKEKLKQAEGEEKKQILEFLERLKKAKQAIAESEDIPQIFANEITTKELKQGKFIMFCPAGEDEDENKESIHRMKTIMKQAPKWFEGVEGIKKIKKYSVYSKLDAKKNSKIIDAFERDDTKALKLLFSINMLNEGLHVDDIDGVIMLRSTGSRIIYLQQLGRALSVGHKHQPKIFDFVANLNYVDVTAMQQMVTEVNNGNKEGGYGGEDVNTTENDLRFKLNVDNLDTLQLIDTLKSNIFTFNHKNDFEFEDFYNRLLAYKNEFGNCLVPLSFVCRDGYPLGSKISLIRKESIKLDEEKKQRLRNIDFVWIASGIDSDNVRVGLKRFVERFNTFILENKRMPKKYEKPKNQNEIEERNLNYAWRRYRNEKNLNSDEINYLEKNLVQLPEDTVRKVVKDFIEEFNAFVTQYKRKPKKIHNPQNQEERNELNLYQKLNRYSKMENLNSDEIRYLKDNKIEVVEEYIDTVRKTIKDFVEKFNAFVKEYGRKPKNVHNPQNQEERDETNLYASWVIYRKTNNLNKYEQEYLITNGIEVIEEYTDTVRKTIKDFVEKFNAFVKEYNREPKSYLNPQNQEEQNETRLYALMLKHRRVKNLNKDEQEYLKTNGIEVVEEYTDTVRKSVKDFIEKFNAFVKEYKREPSCIKYPQNQEERDEANLYASWAIYRKARNLNKDEQNYIQANGIEVQEEYSDTIRKVVKDFVEKFNVFELKYERRPKRIHNTQTQEDREERRLYDSWNNYRKFKNLKNTDEIKYLQEHGIEVLGLEEEQETEIKPSGENFD